MKNWKNALMLSVIASLLISTFAIAPSFASTTTLAVEPALIEGLGPASTFRINITIDDVDAMLSFNLFLLYDTDVLTATGFGNYYPFDYPLPNETRDDAGYVAFAYSMIPPEYYGFFWDPLYGPPYPIAWVDFTVDDYGVSQLNIRRSVISDVYGDEIVHGVSDGVFSNVPGMPLADFTVSPDPAMEDHVVTFDGTPSSDPDGWIASWDWSFGDKSTDTGSVVTHVYAKAGNYTVTLTVTDNDGKTDSYSRVIVVNERPPVGIEVVSTYVTHYELDYSKNGPQFKSVMKAYIKNLDVEKKTLVRVTFAVDDRFGANLGGIESKWLYISPLQTRLFQVEFGIVDFSWQSTPKPTWNIRVQAYYKDYEISPGYPHWAGPVEPITKYSVKGVELPPVADATVTDLGGNVFLFDASASYDPDEKWGDYLSEFRWYIFDYYWNFVAIRFGETYTADLNELGAGQYWVSIRVYDQFGANSWGPDSLIEIV